MLAPHKQASGLTGCTNEGIIMTISVASRVVSFDAFWLRYLRDHADPRTRHLHHAGMALALGSIMTAFTVGPMLPFLIAAPLMAYGLAWFSHAVYEHNTPTAFGHPYWSLISSFRMFGLSLLGRLRAELDRAGVSVRPPSRNTAPARR